MLFRYRVVAITAHYVAAAVDEIAKRFGGRWAYINNNGNDAIHPYVLHAYPRRRGLPAVCPSVSWPDYNKIGLEVALEALRDCWQKRVVTMDELWHYAGICRVANVMRPYLESLVA